ncbi:MAG: hypothetical protein ACXWVA_07855 [Rhodoplanes sp.]
MLLLIVFIMVVRSIIRQSQAYPPTAANRRGRRSGPMVVPIPGSWDSGSSSSDSSWSGSSGGGFSGGGGSFGGGGASGSW